MKNTSSQITRQIFLLPNIVRLTILSYSESPKAVFKISEREKKAIKLTALISRKYKSSVSVKGTVRPF
jgi:hypothetical protein